MIEQRAQVLAIENGQLSLQPMQRAECPRCAAGHGCGGQLFGQMRNKVSPLLISAPTGLSVQAGDVVVIGMQSQHLQQAALLLYTLPLLAVLLAAGLASWLAWSETTQVLSVSVALVGSFLAVRRRTRDLTRQPLLTVLRKDALRKDTLGSCASTVGPD